MEWPQKPTCHKSNSPIFQLGETHWREPEPTRAPYGTTFRTCSYCGSIHPEDLLTLLKGGARLGGSDWKYGWPHKFYVYEIPNPLAGQTVQMGSESKRVDGQIVSSPILGAAPSTQQSKWYNEHLLDDGFDEEAQDALIKVLADQAGIQFTLDGKKLTYSAPHMGYQR